ncbi:hypothetical protein LCGC14_2465530 [marine sediment metagenome]|uniref:Uncharacterized protein n=1 Tax=marine sediment metagenome TaxID=412755 RepID=A0A0F9BZQ4_9ZZZZ
MDRINWKLLWREFQEWYDENNDPEWEAQQLEIEALVEKQLKSGNCK